jgi:hypothetical protein
MLNLTIPKFNQTQLIFISVVFVLLFLMYNFVLCGSVWCYNKMKKE